MAAEPASQYVLGLDRPLLIGREMPAEAVQFRNFDVPEEDFAWSMGRFAELVFDADPVDGPLRLLLDLDVFRAPPVLAGQNVLVYLNGLRVHSAFVVSRGTLEMTLRPGVLETEENTLAFDLPDAIRPIEFGMEDHRMLGVKLFALILEAEA